MSANVYEIRRATEADLPLIERWLGERHVAKWWGKVLQGLAEIREHIHGSDAEPFIVMHEGQPIGYLQTYPAEADADIPPQPSGTLGVDFFIGEVGALGQGHGPGMLNQLAMQCVGAGVVRLVSDPDGRNVSSVGCLGRAGFTPVSLIGPSAARRLLMSRDLVPQPVARSQDRSGRRRQRASRAQRPQ
ncbi:MAG: GNAT family N-acetyltransferase [Hyphomicrobiaceae bacterium]